MNKTDIVFPCPIDLESLGSSANTGKPLANFQSAQNYLLTVVDPIFILFEKIISQKNIADLSDIRSQLSQAIQQFKNTLSHLEYPHEIILMSVFALSAWIDESIEKTPWGRKFQWSKNPLTEEVHDKINPTTHFFDILEYALLKPDQYIDVIELMYICLSLGFKGKYIKNSDKKELIKIKNTTYQVIQSERNGYSEQLSNITTRIEAYKPLRREATPFIFILLFSFAFLIMMIFGELYCLSFIHEHQIEKQLSHLAQ